MQRVFLVDASIYIFRAYFSLPENWRAQNGFATQAVYGYALFLAELLEREQPTRVLVAFDESLGGCFRNEIYAHYKHRRELPDEALAYQLEACKRISELLGLRVVASSRYEADDLIGAAALRAREQGLHNVVLSRDKDLGQLLMSENDRLWDFPRGAAQSRSEYCAQHGIRPEQVPDLLALTGDSIDDIPGVPGIGPKTAVALLQAYSDIEAILAALAAIEQSGLRSARRIAALLAEHAAQLRMARRLTTLCTDEQVLAVLPGFERTAADAAALAQFAQFNGLGTRLEQRLCAVAGGPS